MKTLASQYIEFQTGALLKSTELNDSFNYLIERDRLSRQYLAGLGIAYGLEVVLNTAKNEITITKGAGVTSGGDLIVLEEDCTYNTVGHDGGLSKTDKPNFTQEKLIGKCIVLKLEKSDGFIDNCFIRQDQKNKRFVQTIKPYLKNNTAISIPAQSLTACLENPCLPVVKIEPLKESEKEIYKPLFETYKTANEVGIKSIRSAYAKIHTSDCYQNLFCGQEFKLDDWEKYFAELTLKLPNNIHFQQHIYDYLKTLIAAYDEFASTAWVVQKLEAKLPNIQELALGNASNCDCRHGWYSSLTNGAALKEAQFYASRMIVLTTTSNLNFANIAEKSIKITLSNDNTPLSKKAIPYYFISQNIKNKWSYPLYQTNRVSAIPTYEAAQGCYTEGGNFYRIEGLMGKPIKFALQDLIQKRQSSNTAFDIKVVTLSSDTTDISAYFEDLQRQYHQMRLIILCASQSGSVQLETEVVKSRGVVIDLPLLLKNYCQKLNSNTDDDEKWKVIIDRLRSSSPFCGWIYSLDELCFAYEQRLKDYLFYQFAQKYTGLTYCGGVPQGGTLVLVAMKTGVDNVEDDGKDNIKPKAAAIFLPKSSEYIVVAEFALPYLCCEEDGFIKCILDEKPVFETFEVVDDKGNRTTENIKIRGNKNDQENTFTFEGKLKNSQVYEWYISRFLDKNTRLDYSGNIVNLIHEKTGFDPQATFKATLKAASFCSEDAIDANFIVKRSKAETDNITHAADPAKPEDTTKPEDTVKPDNIVKPAEGEVIVLLPLEDKLRPRPSPVSVPQLIMSDEMVKNVAAFNQRQEAYKKIIADIETDPSINDNKAFNLTKVFVFFPKPKAAMTANFDETIKALSTAINRSKKIEQQQKFMTLLQTATHFYLDKVIASDEQIEQTEKALTAIKDLMIKININKSQFMADWKSTGIETEENKELIAQLKQIFE